MNAIFYLRASTDKQVITEEVQRRMCQEWFDRNAPEGSTACELIDMGISAKIPLFERPQGQHILTSLEKGDVLVVAKLTRAFRSVLDALTSIDILQGKIGARVVILDLNIDMTTPTGRLMFTMLAAIAQFEREVISERITDALRVKMDEGMWVGTPPCGYKLIPKRDTKTKNNKLVPDKMVRDLGMYAAHEIGKGRSPESIAVEISTNVKAFPIERRSPYLKKKWITKDFVVDIAAAYYLDWPPCAKDKIRKSLGFNPYNVAWIKSCYDA